VRVVDREGLKTSFLLLTTAFFHSGIKTCRLMALTIAVYVASLATQTLFSHTSFVTNLEHFLFHVPLIHACGVISTCIFMYINSGMHACRGLSVMLLTADSNTIDNACPIKPCMLAFKNPLLRHYHQMSFST
jgi:hypothetical protein